jgi:hypothetical protein
MTFTEDSLREQIPYYLTADQKAGFLKALEDFPNNINYYGSGYDDDILQGDGWTKLTVVRFETGDRGSIRGIVLSNSCDVASENKRDFPVNITFAPIVPLDEYRKVLEKAGLDPDTIKHKIAVITDQRVTNIFYLPLGAALEQDHIALFGDIHSMPAKAFEVEQAKSKLFTLNLAGFYLFIFKLSIHFCRFHENLARV